MSMNFLKMHGLGNDFVILDQRAGEQPLSTVQISSICDRRRGVGCDQLIIMEPSEIAACFMRIYNPDGSQAEACGNATRCVAHILMREYGREEILIDTLGSMRTARMCDGNLVEVDMGLPNLEWAQIPLAQEVDTLHLPLEEGALSGPVAVNMGNPHCVFFVENAEDIDLYEYGPRFETDDLFPQRANIEFATIMPDDQIRVRVWERAAGVTQACGSASCAVIVAAVKRGLSSRKAEIIMDGGSLFLEYRESDNHVLMTGPVSYVFEGHLK